MKSLWVWSLVWGHLLTAVIASGQSIDREQSTVSFAIRNMKVRTVTGTLAKLTGTAVFNPEKPGASRFEACVDPATIDTGNSKRDEHLRGEDFFDVQQYPSICFRSTGVSKTPLGWATRGLLTMTGVERELVIPFSVEGNTFKGELTLNRLDFNLAASTGTFLVGDEVRISVTCVVNP